LARARHHAGGRAGIVPPPPLSTAIPEEAHHLTVVARLRTDGVRDRDGAGVGGSSARYWTNVAGGGSHSGVLEQQITVPIYT